MHQSLAVVGASGVEPDGRGRQALRALGVLWCRTMHDGVTWPVLGRYHCKQCGRTYSVPFPAEQHRTRRAA